MRATFFLDLFSITCFPMRPMLTYVMYTVIWNSTNGIPQTKNNSAIFGGVAPQFFSEPPPSTAYSELRFLIEGFDSIMEFLVKFF